MFLKSQLHIHNNKDILDTFINYSPEQVIDFAQVLGFQVISFTNHRTFFFTEKLKEYAFQKGIILIPGAEIEINKKHILILNADKDAENIKTFDDLRVYKKSRKILVVAPHPFYGTHFCLGKSLGQNKDVFDAVEYSSYHMNSFLNAPNIKAKNFAKKNMMPLVGTGDVHNIHYFDSTYSLINIDFDIKNMDIKYHNFYVQNILDNINANNVTVQAQPLSFYRFMRLNAFLLSGNIKKYFKKLKSKG